MRSYLHTLCGAASAVAVGLIVSAVPASSSLAATKRCDATHPGSYVHKYRNGQARTFCGPATATVHYQGHAINYRGGDCVVSKGILAINIGTATNTESSNLPKYFGLDIAYQRSAHGYRGVGDFRAFGKGHPIFGMPVTLSSSKLKANSKGTFSGKVFGGSAVTGVFRCS